MRSALERILNLLAFLLTAGRPVTAEEIRNTVAGYDQTSDESFRRMFERDKDLIRRLGVPLERQPLDAWEVDFGYVVSEDTYELQDPGLTDEERAALLLAAQVVRLGAQPSGPDAVLKLGGAVLSDAGEPLAADLGTEVDTLATAFLAAAERRILEFTYRGRHREVHPYGLVHRRGHWYLVGKQGDEIRAFRVDRATDLEAGSKEGAFRRPRGFSARDAVAEAPWEAGSSDVMAEVHFDPELAWWAERQLSGAAEKQRTGDGGLRVRMPVANPDAFVGWMLAFGASAEILEPPELRELLVRRVESAA
ncbi:MAG: helix-turn-helix transcriptional regulator [Acidimicrobiia bacterium]